MNAQQSLKRISSAFQAKPKQDKVQDMAQKLGIPMTPELMQLGSNEAISNALVEIAVGMGKTEEEISAALGSEWTTDTVNNSNGVTEDKVIGKSWSTLQL